MNTLIFDTQLLPDGHLDCPQEFAHKPSIQFKVIAIFEEQERVASDQDIERAAIHDTFNEYLTSEELNYYLALGDV
jgi:hypothetical protein